MYTGGCGRGGGGGGRGRLRQVGEGGGGENVLGWQDTAAIGGGGAAAAALAVGVPDWRHSIMITGRKKQPPCVCVCIGNLGYTTE